MRTLKKTLCLVLVLAMMVGLCAIGASAVAFDDYKDKTEIKHQEAVALLSALSVLQGDERGFRPGEGLTRAEGAKIIAALLNANVNGLKSNFTDMAGHWADSYVAYCASIGIINGYGDGRFGPEDALTYAQFAKMLLVALGYDATREELTGASWEIGVAKLVNQVGLAKGVLDFSYNDSITRDDAAQMAFVTLTTVMVGYNGNGIAVAGGNLATPREILTNTTYDYDSDIIQDGRMQFIENYFPDYKLYSNSDDYGLTTHYWFKGADRSDRTFKESKTVAKVIASRVLATYTTNVALVTLDTLYKDGGFDKTVNDLAITENGIPTTKTITPVKGNTLPPFPLAQYAGATIYMVDTTSDGLADELLVKYPLLAKVKGIIKAEDSATKERQVELSVYVNDGAAYKVVEPNFDTDKFSKGEFVLVYPQMKFDDVGAFGVGTPIIELTTVDSTIGTLGKVNLANGAVNALTVDGIRYSVGGGMIANMGPDKKVVGTDDYAKYGLNKEITLYTANGYVMGVNTTATPLSDYVYIMGVGGISTDLITKVSTCKVAYVKQDGSTVTSSVAAVNNKESDTVAKYQGHWAIATPRGDTTSFTLAPIPTMEKPTIAATLSPKNPSIAGVTANNKTNFIVLSGSGAATSVKAYAGISAVPTFSTAANATALVDSDGKAVAVFFNYSGKTADSTATNPLFFLTANPDGTIQDGPSTYYTFNTVDSKGTVSQISIASTATIRNAGDDPATAPAINWSSTTPLTQGAGLYVPETNEKGVITGLVIPKNTVAGYTGYFENVGFTGTISAGDGVITGLGSHTVASDVAIYRFNFLGQMKAVDGLDDLDGRTGTLAVVGSAATGKVTTIFFMG